MHLSARTQFLRARNLRNFLTDFLDILHNVAVELRSALILFLCRCDTCGTEKTCFMKHLLEKFRALDMTRSRLIHTLKTTIGTGSLNF